MTVDSYLQFRRADRECLLCGTSLPDVGKHPSILKFGEKAETIRQDFCPKCWGQMEHREYFSYWLTRRLNEGPSPEERKLVKAERNERLWALFNALYAERSEELAPHLFLLAHLLMKYRVLAFQGREGDELRFLHAPSQETYRIADLPLSAVSFIDVKEEIDGRMKDEK